MLTKMDKRAKAITHTLFWCLLAGLLVSAIKLAYGISTKTLAFVADGIHSLFDSAATLVGIVSVTLSAKPPDDGHPYGHHKFETVAAVTLALFLFLAAYEVGTLSYHRILNPFQFPAFSFLGVFILFFTMVVNLVLAKWESKVARDFTSHFLASDSLHNQSDFWITCAVLVSLTSVQFHIPYIDSAVSILIAMYLFSLSIRLLIFNLKPLVDHSVLDPKMVEKIVSSTEGVLHCHNIRSRGHFGHQFLDLNIHLPGKITLERAHEITHHVEDRLKQAFPGLVDVVIHSEPHNHPPCSKS